MVVCLNICYVLFVGIIGYFQTVSFFKQSFTFGRYFVCVCVRACMRVCACMYVHVCVIKCEVTYTWLRSFAHRGTCWSLHVTIQESLHSIVHCCKSN